MHTSPPPELAEHIMKRFDFTAADLEANRTGKHSQRQADVYLARTPKWSAMFSLTGLLLAIFLGLSAGFNPDGTIFELAQDGLPWDTFDWPTGIGVLTGATLFLATPPLGFWWMMNRWPLRRGVKTITGPFQLVDVKTKYSSIPSLAVGKGMRARNFLRQEGDEHLAAYMPTATLYYNQGWAKTIVHSIEPADTRS